MIIPRILTKYRICKAIDVRMNGEEHECYVIQKRNIFFIWKNATQKDKYDNYFGDTSHLTFDTIEKAKEELEDFINQEFKNKVGRVFSKIIKQKHIHGYDLRIKKVIEISLNKSKKTTYYIQKKNLIGIWSYCTKNDIGEMDNYVLSSHEKGQGVKYFETIIDNINTKFENKTSTKTNYIGV